MRKNGFRFKIHIIGRVAHFRRPDGFRGLRHGVRRHSRGKRSRNVVRHVSDGVLVKIANDFACVGVYVGSDVEFYFLALQNGYALRKELINDSLCRRFFTDGVAPFRRRIISAQKGFNGKHFFAERIIYHFAAVCRLLSPLTVIQVVDIPHRIVVDFLIRIIFLIRIDEILDRKPLDDLGGSRILIDGNDHIFRYILCRQSNLFARLVHIFTRDKLTAHGISECKVLIGSLSDCKIISLGVTRDSNLVCPSVIHIHISGRRFSADGECLVHVRIIDDKRISGFSPIIPAAV